MHLARRILPAERLGIRVSTTGESGTRSHYPQENGIQCAVSPPSGPDSIYYTLDLARFGGFPSKVGCCGDASRRLLFLHPETPARRAAQPETCADREERTRGTGPILGVRGRSRRPQRRQTRRRIPPGRAFDDYKTQVVRGTTTRGPKVPGRPPAPV